MLSYKEKIDLAEWLAVMNNGAISGSLMLKRRGIDLDREIGDIDIIVSEDMEQDDIILPPFTKDKEFDNGDDGYTLLSRCYCLGTKIEFIQDNNSLQNAKKGIGLINHEAKYCIINDLVKAKKEYISIDSNADYIEKSKKDLIIINNFISQFPIHRYTVNEIGNLYHLTCNEKIDNDFKFKVFALTNLTKFDEWKMIDKEQSRFYSERYKNIDDEKLYDSINEAIITAKARWNKIINPLSLYRVVHYFDNHFVGYSSEPMSKRDAYDLSCSLNRAKKEGDSYNIKAINTN